MKRLFCLWLLGIQTCQGVDFGGIALTHLGEISKTFAQTVQFSFPCPQPQHILRFGNPKVGYYKTIPIQQTHQTLTAKLLPPTYESPIEFYAQTTKGSLHYLGSKQFVSPLPKLLQSVRGKSVHGILSSPFTLLYGTFADPYTGRIDFSSGAPSLEKLETPKRNLFVYIVNSLGEIVWLHFPDQGRHPFGREDNSTLILAKPLSQGRLGLLLNKKESYLEIVDLFGRVEVSAHPRLYNVHHDFVELGEEDWLTLGSAPSNYPQPRRPWRQDRFVLDQVQLTNLKKNSAQILWEGGEWLNPLTEPDWKWLQRRSNREGYWSGFGEKSANYDLMHTNSIFPVPGKGYLLSLRNLSKILMVDEAFGKILWSLGESSSNTYHFANTDATIHKQHDVSLTPSGNLLVFDNGRKRSRVVELTLTGNTARLAREFLPTPEIYAPTRGSAYLLPSGNLLAYFVRHTKAPPVTNSLVEFDGKTQKEVARMDFTLESVREGYRAMSLSSLSP